MGRGILAPSGRMTLWAHARLSSEEQKTAKTTAFDLQLNPANPGMSFHKLDRARDKKTDEADSHGFHPKIIRFLPSNPSHPWPMEMWPIEIKNRRP